MYGHRGRIERGTEGQFLHTESGGYIERAARGSGRSRYIFKLKDIWTRRWVKRNRGIWPNASKWDKLKAAPWLTS